MLGALLPLGLLAGCQTATLVGEVRTADGGPVPGAMLRSPGCEAVTDAAGRFRVACAKGTRSFTVTHPDHLDRTWLVTPAGGLGDQDVGSVDLAPIPLGEGLWLATDGRLDRLPEAPFVRTAAATEQRWCMDATQGEPVGVASGEVRLLDNHGVDWRLYKLDADGCAYRLTKSGGDHWTFTAERVTPRDIAPRGPGRDWVTLDLPPGDYALVEWYEGFLVRDTGERFRGHWLRAGAPTAPTPGEAAAGVDRPVEAGPAE